MEARLFYVADTRPDAIAELSRVSLRRPIAIDRHKDLPAGASGTIVAVLKEGVAYMVEFAEPFETLVDVGIEDFDAIPGESRDDLLAGRMARRGR